MGDIQIIALSDGTAALDFIKLLSKERARNCYFGATWCTQLRYNSDPGAYMDSIATRRPAQNNEKAYADAARNGYWIAADHISFPGIGHLRADGSKYVWIPANYSVYPPIK